MSDIVHIPVKRSAAARIAKSTMNGRGCRITADDIDGSGLFDVMKKAAKSGIGKAVLKVATKELLPMATSAMGNAVTAYTGNAALGNLTSNVGNTLGQEAAKQATGGKLAKGSQAAKDRMKAIRAMKRGGSFIPIGG
jgi:hypothetical protein